MKSLSRSHDDNLCERCSKIDFDKIFTTEHVQPQEILVHDLGNLKEGKQTASCALCRFFFSVRAPVPGLRVNEEDDEEEEYYLRFVSTTQKNSLQTVSSNMRNNLALAVVSGESGLRENWQPHDARHSLIVPVSDPTRHSNMINPFQGGQVNQHLVSYNRIKEWIDRCQNQHVETCQRPLGRRPLGLRCIDCATGKVVQIDEADRYFALSYVWGHPSTLETGNIHQWHDTIPKRFRKYPGLVRDAVAVVNGLGERYLWVDKFCIDQNDAKSKHEQISRMDQIYEGASATIVASACRDGNERIPGVGRPRKDMQPSVKVGRHLLVSSLQSMSVAVADSVWATRGWTYQEAAVSRRCLYFTDSQVYFVCATQSCSESLPYGGMDVGLDHLGNLSTETRFGHSAPGPELRQLVHHLKCFSDRSLTYPTDILDAFRGLLARSGFPSYFGVPIAPSDDRTTLASFRRSMTLASVGFARGLYWLPCFDDTSCFNTTSDTFQRLVRRVGFPSWSWTGWIGAVEYPESCGPPNSSRGGPLMSYDRPFTHIKTWIEDKGGALIELDRWITLNRGARLLPELSPFVQIEAMTIQLRLQVETFRKADLSICRCHLSDQHHGNIDSDDVLGVFIPCESPIKTDAHYQRLLATLWTGIVLFKSHFYDQISHSILLVDWHGDFAERIGAVTLRGDLPSELIQKRQRVRLA